MPFITKVQAQKQALAGAMRIAPEGTAAAWCVFCNCSAELGTYIQSAGQVIIYINVPKVTAARIRLCPLIPMFLRGTGTSISELVVLLLSLSRRQAMYHG